MKYDFDLDLDENNNLSILLSRVKKESVILEFGPANGRTTKYLKEQLACKVYCVELDEKAAKELVQYSEKVLVENIEEYHWKSEFDGIAFDHIIFADVLEHLYDPKKILLESKKFLKDDGSILVSLPNIAHNSIIMQLMQNEFNYKPTGLLDNTHIRFFTKNSFDLLIEECDLFRIFEKGVFASPKNSEFKNDYNDLPKEVGEYLKTLPWGELYHLVYEIKKYETKIESDLSLQIATHQRNYTELFIDVESKKISKVYAVDIDQIGSIQKIVFDLSDLDSIKNLRVDPFNASCIIKIETLQLIKENNEIVSLKPYMKTNATLIQDDSYYFMEDSQITFDNLPNELFEGVQTLLFSVVFVKMGQEALELIVFEKEKIIDEKEKIILDHHNTIEEKQKHIEALGALAQSLRLKNRAKRIVKKFIPKKIWNILRHIKNNPHSLKKAFYILKNQGVTVFIEKIKNIDNKNMSVIYSYEMPHLSQEIKKEIEHFSSKPLISIIMPVYNVDPKWLDLAIKSIENQWYDNWELCICDDKSTNTDTVHYLQQLKNNKIKIKFSEQNGNISVASNEALKMASGTYIALMDNDDEITVDALYEVVKAINENKAEFIYSDEDKLNMDGSFCEPHFKPDYSPDMFLSQNYLSHLGVIKKELIDTVGGFTVGLEGAQDYDLYLKVLENTDKISHIPKVLYHWRKIAGSTAVEFHDKSYAQDAGRDALQNALIRRSIDGNAFNSPYPGIYKVEYDIKNNPLVSIIIPFKDMPKLLQVCIDSIIEKTSYKNFEIIGISNNSEEEATFKEIQRCEKLDKRVKFYEYNVPFNYSLINNFAVNTYAKGEHIILLNNDIEILCENWIEELLMHSQREEVGCVGAKLYYPNDTIQHGGVIMGLGGVACHAHKEFPKNHPGYFRRLQSIQNFSAVTAACLMVKRSIFDELDGLNEKDLKIAFNDVDFCLRARKKGYLNIFTPYCEAYHYESISRGLEDNPEKMARFQKEIDFMQDRHKEILENGDPYYNPNLTLNKEDFGLR